MCGKRSPGVLLRRARFRGNSTEKYILLKNVCCNNVEKKNFDNQYKKTLS